MWHPVNKSSSCSDPRGQDRPGLSFGYTIVSESQPLCPLLFPKVVLVVVLTTLLVVKDKRNKLSDIIQHWPHCAHSVTVRHFYVDPNPQHSRSTSSRVLRAHTPSALTLWPRVGWETADLTPDIFLLRPPTHLGSKIQRIPKEKPVCCIRPRNINNYNCAELSPGPPSAPGTVSVPARSETWDPSPSIPPAPALHWPASLRCRHWAGLWGLDVIL